MQANFFASQTQRGLGCSTDIFAAPAPLPEQSRRVSRHLLANEGFNFGRKVLSVLFHIIDGILVFLY